MNSQSERIRKARKKLRLRIKISDFVDKVLTKGAENLKMCGEGKKNNFSVLFAQIFYTECPCCNFYRGMTVGVFSALTLALVAFSLFV